MRIGNDREQDTTRYVEVLVSAANIVIQDSLPLSHGRSCSLVWQSQALANHIAYVVRLRLCPTTQFPSRSDMLEILLPESKLRDDTCQQQAQTFGHISKGSG